MDRKNSAKRQPNLQTYSSSPKKRTINITWTSDLYQGKKIKSEVENTWIQQQVFNFPNVAEFAIKAGNKEYHLNSNVDEGDRESEVQLKKRYQ